MQKKSGRGMKTHQAKMAMLGLIAVLLLVLIITLFQPALIQSFDDLLPLIKHNPPMFYLLNLLCIAVAIYVGFFKK